MPPSTTNHIVPRFSWFCKQKTKSRLSSGTASDPASQIDIGRIEGQRVYHNNKPLVISHILIVWKTARSYLWNFTEMNFALYVIITWSSESRFIQGVSSKCQKVNKFYGRLNGFLGYSMAFEKVEKKFIIFFKKLHFL